MTEEIRNELLSEFDIKKEDFREVCNKKGEPYYYITKEALDDMHDINRTLETFECFVPMYVVSRRVYDYLSKKRLLYQTKQTFREPSLPRAKVVFRVI